MNPTVAADRWMDSSGEGQTRINTPIPALQHPRDLGCLSSPSPAASPAPPPPQCDYGSSHYGWKGDTRLTQRRNLLLVAAPSVAVTCPQHVPVLASVQG